MFEKAMLGCLRVAVSCMTSVAVTVVVACCELWQQCMDNCLHCYVLSSATRGLALWPTHCAQRQLTLFLATAHDVFPLVTDSNEMDQNMCDVHTTATRVTERIASAISNASIVCCLVHVSVRDLRTTHLPCPDKECHRVKAMLGTAHQI